MEFLIILLAKQSCSFIIIVIQQTKMLCWFLIVFQDENDHLSTLVSGGISHMAVQSSNRWYTTSSLLCEFLSHLYRPPFSWYGLGCLLVCVCASSLLGLNPFGWLPKNNILGWIFFVFSFLFLMFKRCW